MADTINDGRSSDIPKILREAADRFDHSSHELAETLEREGPIGAARTLGRQEVYDWFVAQFDAYLNLRPAPVEDAPTPQPRRPSADQAIDDL